MGWISDKDKLASIYKEHDILLNSSIKYKDWEELFGIVNNVKKQQKYWVKIVLIHFIIMKRV